jgi:hypothetical protein
MLVSFNSNGYVYGDVDGTEFFSCNSSHDELFHFIGCDLSKLPGLLQTYMNNYIDFDTLEPKNTNKERNLFDEDSSPIREIEEILCEAHPFFEHGATNFLKDEINTFLIGLTLNKTFNKDTYELTKTYDYEWYYTRIHYLINEGASDYTFHDELCHKYANEYIEMIKQDDCPYESYSDIPPTGFRSLLGLQDLINEWLFWILDVSVPYLSDLTVSKRAYLYNELFPYMDDMPMATINTRMSFTNPHGKHLGGNYRRNDSNKDTVWFLNGDLGHLHKTGAAPKEALDELNDIVKYLQNTETQIGIFTEYEIDNPYNLLFLEISQMIDEGIRVKRCRHCNRYFIVYNLNTEYCNNIALDEQEPCSKIGSKQAYKSKVASDPALAEYQRSYKTHHARIRNNKMTQADFLNWANEAKLKLTDARSGTLSLDEFKEWLKI